LAAHGGRVDGEGRQHGQDEGRRQRRVSRCHWPSRTGRSKPRSTRLGWIVCRKRLPARRHCLCSGSRQEADMRPIALPIAVLCLAAAGFFARSTSVRADDSSPPYMNVEVVRVDPLRRLITVRKPQGSEETMELDERLAGFGGVAPGDHVILTVRRQPGRAWVNAIVKATPPPSSDGAT